MSHSHSHTSEMSSCVIDSKCRPSLNEITEKIDRRRSVRQAQLTHQVTLTPEVAQKFNPNVQKKATDEEK